MRFFFVFFKGMVSEVMCLKKKNTNNKTLLLIIQGYFVTEGGGLFFKQLHLCYWFCLLPLEFLSWTMKNIPILARSYSKHCFSLPSRKVMSGKAARDQIFSLFTLFPFQFSCSRTLLWSLHWQANIADFIKPSRTFRQELQLLSFRTTSKSSPVQT